MPVDSPRNPLGVLFAAFNGFQRTAALKAAIDLDLFTAIGEGRTTPSELAQRCGASERGLRILCDTLAALDFVRKDGGHYALDPDLGMFLDRHSPAYVGSAANFLASPMVTEAFGALTAAVRKGGTAIAEEAVLAPEHPVWVDFARSMAPLAGLSARLLTNLLDAPAGAPWKVLDIAAGHGMFGIALAQENPNARIVALDWANVLAVAHENARAAGVADRFRTLPGSALTVDYGQGGGLAANLRRVAALISAGMPTRLYYVTYQGNSFDTHVQQADLHSRLLMYTADAVRGFIEDLRRIGHADEVAVMIFTEFGRRVEENGSLGTDHGTATPMFVIGKGVKGGFYGTPPSLTDLDDGNLKMTTDFRRVYATAIREWLGCDQTETILKGRFEPLGVFV